MLPMCHLCLFTFLCFFLRSHLKSCDTNNEESNSQSITTKWIACICLSQMSKVISKTYSRLQLNCCFGHKQTFCPLHPLFSSHHPTTHLPTGWPTSRSTTQIKFLLEHYEYWHIMLPRVLFKQVPQIHDVWRGGGEIWCPRESRMGSLHYSWTRTTYSSL